MHATLLHPFTYQFSQLRVALVCLLAVILGIAASANRIVRKTKDASGNDVTDDDLIHKLWYLIIQLGVVCSRSPSLHRIIQFGVQVPLIVIFFLLSWTSKPPRARTRHVLMFVCCAPDVYHDFSQQIGTALGLCIGGLTIAVSVMGGEPDHGPHMLYFFIVRDQSIAILSSLTSSMLFFAAVLVHFAALPVRRERMLGAVPGLHHLGEKTRSNAMPQCASDRLADALASVVTRQVKIVVPENDRFGTSVGYMIIANLALMFATYFTEYWYESF